MFIGTPCIFNAVIKKYRFTSSSKSTDGPSCSVYTVQGTMPHCSVSCLLDFFKIEQSSFYFTVLWVPLHLCSLDNPFSYRRSSSECFFNVMDNVYVWGALYEFLLRFSFPKNFLGLNLTICGIKNDYY